MDLSANAVYSTRKGIVLGVRRQAAGDEQGGRFSSVALFQALNLLPSSAEYGRESALKLDTVSRYHWGYPRQYGTRRCLMNGRHHMKVFVARKWS